MSKYGEIDVGNARSADFHKRVALVRRPRRHNAELQRIPARLVPPPTDNRQGSPSMAVTDDTRTHASIYQGLFQHSPTNKFPAR